MEIQTGFSAQQPRGPGLGAQGHDGSVPAAGARTKGAGCGPRALEDSHSLDVTVQSWGHIPMPCWTPQPRALVPTVEEVYQVAAGRVNAGL